MRLQTRFWFLAALRWLPTGFIIPVIALLPLERGLSLAQLGGVMAVQGIVVLCLELPTGGFADALGRKPVYLASALFGLATYLTGALAQTVAAFVLMQVFSGIYRALDSGPLNAWFVDAVHDDPTIERHSEVIARGLSGYASVVGASIAVGSVLSGALIAWAPFSQETVLALPFWVAAAITCVQILAVTIVMSEDRTARIGGVISSVRATPRTVLNGVGLLSRSRVLRALVAVELFWGFGMVAFESFTPIRLAELVDGRDAAAAMMGPATAAAWGVSALGAASVPWLLRHWSMIRVSVALRIVQGATVVAMGFAGGAWGLLAGLFATYAVHSAAGAIYETLLHEQVTSQHRATVLSLASMAMQPAGALSAVVLSIVASTVSVSAAFVVAGVVMALAAPLFVVREKPSAEDHPSAGELVPDADR